MQNNLIITSDGSHTLFSQTFNEHYHSIHGAVQESMHIFINYGLLPLSNNYTHINIFEVGFGTGLNTLLTYLQTTNPTFPHLFYHSIEPYPIHPYLYEQFNHTTLVQLHLTNTNFNAIYTCAWEQVHKINPKFSLLKQQTTLQNIQLIPQNYHIIYFDAFSPENQPEMWTENQFEKLFNCLINKGILITYCAKGVVKRTLKKIGFEILTLPGPNGKREIIKAIKP